MQEKLNINEIIKVEQLPKVFEQLELIGAYVDEQVKDVDQLKCTEENKQEVKNRRTEINNMLTLIDTKRKEIKKKINEPYDLFNKKYEETVKIKLENASKLLTDKINKIEDEQKLVKRNAVEKYFNEYCQFLKVDFVKFEQVGLNITLGISDKKLQEQTKDFLDKVNDDLTLIDSQEHKEEILIEYKKNLNASQSITMIVNRYKELEEMKKKQEELKQVKEAEKENVQRVEQVLSAPTKIEIKTNDEEILQIAFSVRGTREKLKELVQFLKEREYDYEQCNN
ncbi:MAG: DUF1351 domain-containing protein [Bacilli bacterium]|jgi:hypothetical protein|nr:DUF1351 domain-containing protein [Bacilli bacterium]